jgi:hypothetical protein
MNTLVLSGCIYELMIKGKPYVGQSRRLDSERLPTIRWKRHIADSKTPKTAVHAAIHDNGGIIDTQSVLEYIERPIDASKLIIARLLNKTKTTKDLKKYTVMLQCLLSKTADCDEVEEENETITTVDLLLSPKEKVVKDSIDSFIELINDAEIRWVKEKNSMIPTYGGSGYNHAPPGGALPHEPHTEEHKKYMSALMKGRIISQAQREMISKARKGKPLSKEHKKTISETEQKKFNEIIFPKRLAEWIAQYNRLGYSPDSNSEDIDERRAGQWRQDMIAKRKGGGGRGRTQSALTEEQITILTNTTGWLWEQPDEFLIQFENFKEQYYKYDGKIRRSSGDPEHIQMHRAALWIIAMRQKKRKNHPYLTPERIKILDECDIWSWIPTAFITFENRVKSWVSIYTKNKRIPSLGSDDLIERNIASWQIKMRIDYHKKEKRMTEDKIATLNSLEGWAWSCRD